MMLPCPWHTGMFTLLNVSNVIDLWKYTLLNVPLSYQFVEVHTIKSTVIVSMCLPSDTHVHFQ